MQQHDGTSIKLLKYPQVDLVHGAPSQHLDIEAVVAQHRIDRSPHLSSYCIAHARVCNEGFHPKTVNNNCSHAAPLPG